MFERLPALARTTSAETFVVMSNGHGPWQMAICNTMSRGDRVLVCESGHFAVAWGVVEVVVTIVDQLFLPQWVSTLAVKPIQSLRAVVQRMQSPKQINLMAYPMHKPKPKINNQCQDDDPWIESFDIKTLWMRQQS